MCGGRRADRRRGRRHGRRERRLVGAKGIYGALIGVGVVAVFFGISIVAVGKAAKVSPMAMMVTALGSFVVKIVAFMIVVVALHVHRLQRPQPRLHRARLILAWSAAQAVTAMRMQTLYVEPEHEQSRSGAARRMSWATTATKPSPGRRDAGRGAGTGSGLGTGWTVFSYLISGMLAYGGIGWVIGQPRTSRCFSRSACWSGWVSRSAGSSHHTAAHKQGNPPKGDDR